jgi:hypothetical protein
MRRYKHLFTIYLLLLCSCSNSSQKNEKTVTTAENKDQTPNTINSGSGDFYFVERAFFDNKNFFLVVKSLYLFTDSLEYDSSYYCQGNFLYIENKTTRSIDSIHLVEGCENGVLIEDLTKKLQFKTPIFNIATPGGSDTYINEFIGYENDSLKKLFEIFNYNTVDLERKDQNTLIGFVKDRDEVVYDFQDYPVTVSLNDCNVKITRPANQKIGYETQVLSDFEGYQILNNSRKQFLVKEGTTVLIDSLNRNTNIVRIVVNDSVTLYVPLLQLKDKIQGNTAG